MADQHRPLILNRSRRIEGQIHDLVRMIDMRRYLVPDADGWECAQQGRGRGLQGARRKLLLKILQDRAMAKQCKTFSELIDLFKRPGT